LEENVKIKVSSENILEGTLFPTVISRKTEGNHISFELVTRKKGSQ
jgi:hypothetical protein